MLLTACVFGTGIMLAVTGPNYSYGGPTGWLQLHRLSFIAWLFFMAIHVLAYVWRLPRLLAAEARGVSLPEGGTGGPGGDPGGGPAGRRAPGGTPGGRWQFSAAVASGSPCWSPRCSPAW